MLRAAFAATGSMSAARCDFDRNWDNQEGSNSLKDSVYHRVILIRHGQYVAADSDKERVLTALGRAQCNLTGQRLKELQNSGQIPPIKSVVYSTMTRATESAQIILPHIQSDEVKIQATDLIREGACHRPIPPISFDKWPMTSNDFWVDGARIESGFREFLRRPFVVESPAGKGSNKDLGSSYTSVLVCHGNVIRYFVCRALQIDPEAWLRMAVDNGSYTVLDFYASGKVSLRTLGNNGHMRADDITYS